MNYGFSSDQVEKERRMDVRNEKRTEKERQTCLL